jgi:hypothetical protein
MPLVGIEQEPLVPHVNWERYSAIGTVKRTKGDVRMAATRAGKTLGLNFVLFFLGHF